MFKALRLDETFRSLLDPVRIRLLLAFIVEAFLLTTVLGWFFELPVSFVAFIGIVALGLFWLSLEVVPLPPLSFKGVGTVLFIVQHYWLWKVFDEFSLIFVAGLSVLALHSFRNWESWSEKEGKLTFYVLALMLAGALTGYLLISLLISWAILLLNQWNGLRQAGAAGGFGSTPKSILIGIQTASFLLIGALIAAVGYAIYLLQGAAQWSLQKLVEFMFFLLGPVLAWLFSNKSSQIVDRLGDVSFDRRNLRDEWSPTDPAFSAWFDAIFNVAIVLFMGITIYLLWRRMRNYGTLRLMGEPETKEEKVGGSEFERGGFGRLWKRKIVREPISDPVRALYIRYLSLLHGAVGIKRENHMTPDELATSVMSLHRGGSEHVREITKKYVIRRYSNEAIDPSDLQQLEAHLKQLREEFERNETE